MAKVEGVKITEPWGYDILLPILKDAYFVLFYSYQRVYAERVKHPYTRPINAKKWYLEDLITDDLIKDEESLPKLFDYRLVNQQKDATKNTRIDIAIQWSLIFGHSYDIKIECKLLNKKNIDYIIESGLKKFKNNLYGERLPLAGMLVYNTTGEIVKNLFDLNNKIESKLSNSERFNQIDVLSDYDYTYISKHTRLSNTNIDLYTMIIDFKNVIIN